MKHCLKKSILTAALLLTALAMLLALFALLEFTENRKFQQTTIAELEEREGEYDKQTVVLYDTSPNRADELAKKYNAELRITSNGKFATLALPEGVTILDIYSDSSNLKYLKELSADYLAEIAAPSTSSGKTPVRPNHTVTDDKYDNQVYLDYLNIGTAWSKASGSGITVAVIDTGIDTDHPEFSGRISEFSYNATEDKTVKDHGLSVIEDADGHGTAVAGAIAASMGNDGITGIAPSVNLLIIKAESFGNGKFSRVSDLVFGLYYAIEQNADVVNMSFGSSEPENPFADAVQLAIDSDIVCVAAAGNDSSAQRMYPAADKNVIGVGALADESWELADYSNYGENADMVAPGTVYTTLIGGTYGIMDGTSMAAPLTTGAIALYLTQDKYATVSTVREILYASCSDLGNPGKDWIYGYGALDVNALVVEERGTVTFDMMTDELSNVTAKFIRNHTLQNIITPERLYSVFDGWYYDAQCTEEYQLYSDKFTSDLTLYAKWVNEEDGIPYTYVVLDDNTVEIRSYTGKRRYITIPEQIDGMVVSSIGDEAFLGMSNLREIVLPSGLKKIGRSAFEGCTSLIEMYIPDNVTYVGENAFWGNIRLNTLAIGGDSKLTTVGSFAFSSCTALDRIELPASLVSVNGSAFYGATGLKSISVRNGSKNFASKDGVLFNNTAGTLVAYPADKDGNYVIPASVNTIGSYAFAYSDVTSVDLSKVSALGKNAFSHSALEAVVIPDSVTSMDNGVFSDAESLASVTIGGGLTLLPEAAFYRTAVTSIEIPAQITEIGKSAFEATSLTSVTFAEDSALSVIHNKAFKGLGITELVLPKDLMSIGEEAFAYCTALSSVSFGKGLQTISHYAFANTSALSEVVFPSNLSFVGDYAFSSSAVGAVNITAKLSSLGRGAFAYCGNLKEFTVEKKNSSYTAVDGILYTKDLKTLTAYPVGKDAAEFVSADTTEVIGAAAFEGASRLTSVTLSGVAKIAYKGFYRCSAVTSYSLPETLTEIGESAFSYNGALASISIPDSVNLLARDAFAYDFALKTININDTSSLGRIGMRSFAYTGITSIRIPTNVSSVAQWAFEGCNALTSVTFAKNSKLVNVPSYMLDGAYNVKTVTFESGSSLKNLGAHAFEGLTKLTKVDFGGAQLEKIGNYAFRFCESLTTITLPDSLSDIGRFSFYGAKALKSLTLPEGLEHIGSYAFLDDESLNLYFKSDFLPLFLDERWDESIRGYYLSVSEAVTEGDWQYAKLNSGMVAVVAYTGTATSVDMTALDFDADIVGIGGNAFAGASVKSVKLPDTLVNIQAKAFANSSIESITVPASTEFIGREAFYNTPLASVTFENGGKLRVIERRAFAHTKSLASAVLPKSLELLGSEVFFESGISSVTFEEGIAITEIPKLAFARTKITSVTIPAGVTLVNDGAFSENKNLKKAEFACTGDFSLAANVFYGTGLESFAIPANLTYIGEFSLVGLENLSAFEIDENNPNYMVIDGLLLSKDGRKLIAAPAGRTGSLTLPVCVEEIGYGAFENSRLSAVIFDANANILSLGYRAFYGAKNITEIRIPESVVEIGYYAFANAEKLHTVHFEGESRIKGIYEGAFYGAKSLKNITLPDSVVEISDFAFYGCLALEKLPISENSKVKGIYSYAFAHTGLKEAVLPEGINDIGEYAFKGSALTNAVIPDTNKETLVMGIGVFDGCDKLTEITLPFIGRYLDDSEMTWLGYTFGAGKYTANDAYVPKSLKTVSFTDGMTFVGKNAFRGLISLEQINLPKTVVESYSHAFSYYIDNITSSSYRSIPAKYEYFNEIQFIDDKGNVATDLCIHTTSLYYNYYIGSGISGELNIAHGPTILGDLRYYRNLTSVIIPGSVESRFSFYGCSKLKSATLLEGVKSIGSSCFTGCNALTDITIPASATDIKYGSLGYHQNSTTPPLRNLVNIKIDPNNTSIKIVDGILYSPTEMVYITNNAKTDIVVPDGITSIPSYMFKGRNVTSIVLPDSLKTIGDRAFEGCTQLKSVKFPASLTSIGMYTFSGCSSLEAIELIDTKITTITSYNFSGCSSVKTISLPATVTSIASGAFSRSALESVTVHKDNSKFFSQDGILYDKTTNSFVLVPMKIKGEITIPEGITQIPNSTFYNINTITKITLPAGIESIGVTAFSDCSSLEEINLPKEIVSLGAGAFKNCTSLKSADLPESLTTLGTGIFTGCESLSEITFPTGITTVPNSMFDGCSSLTSVTLHDNVKNIHEYAFRNCTTLNSITLPSGLTSISSQSFYNCGNLWIVNNNSDIKLTIGSTNNGYVAKYAKMIVDKDGNKTVKEDVSDLEVITTDDGFKFIATNGSYSLISYEGDEKTVTLPSDINGNSYSIYYFSGAENIIIPETVISISDYAFYNNSKLKSVTFHNGVKTIGAYAFYYCKSLEEIILPQSLTSIGKFCFYGCTKLKSINIPNGVTAINAETFRGCSVLESVVIPDSVTKIDHRAFMFCYKLKDVTIPNGVTYLGYATFYDCRALESIEIPDSVITMEKEAQFQGCTSLKYAKLSAKCSYLPDGAFSGCTSLTTVVIPEGLRSVARSVFRNCTSLKEITLPSTLTYIGEGMFEYCTALETLNIPKNVSSINNTAFTGCSIKNLSVSKDNRYFEVIDGVLYNEALTSIVYVSPTAEEVTIPATVTSISTAFNQNTTIKKIVFAEGSRITAIPASAFTGCTLLESIVLPDKLTTIGDSAFVGCTSLSSIVLPDTVTSIGKNAFKNCTALTSVTMSQGLTSLGAYSFYNCPSLEEITLPSTLTTWGEYAFYSCSSLKTVNISQDIAITAIPACTFYKCSSLEEITIPQNVTSIGGSAFYECKSLSQINLPSGLKTLGSNAFVGCVLIETVEIPIGVTQITGTFKNCTSLKNVKLHDGITLIGNSCFFGCTSLQSIVIPDTVTAIHGSAFDGCTALQSIVIPDAVTYIGGSAFNGCTALESIVIPDTVTSIGDSAFKGCTYLTTVTISDNSKLTGIGTYAFENCTSLVKINIPDGVTSIGNYAFKECKSLEYATIGKNSKLTKLGQYAFYKCSSLKEFYLPAGITSIEARSFDSCSQLRTVEIAENSGLTSIKEAAFHYCGRLIKFDIPSTVTEIGSDAFYGADIKNVVIPEGFTTFPNAFGSCDITTLTLPSTLESFSHFLNWGTLYVIYNNSNVSIDFDYSSSSYASSGGSVKKIVEKDGTVRYRDGIEELIDTEDGFRFTKEKGVYKLRQYVGLEETITLPDSFNGNPYTLFKFISAENVIIPESYTSIPSSAFATDLFMPQSLKSVVIPNTVTSIGQQAFYYASAVKTIVIPDGVTNIGSKAFGCMNNLEKLSIPSSVTSIVPDIFYDCNKLKEIVITGDNPICLYKDGVLYDKDSIIYVSPLISGHVELDGRITEIPANQFKDCTGITSVTIPDSVTKIGDSAFYGCTSLENVKLSKNLSGYSGLGKEVFSYTPYYDNLNTPENRVNGVVYGDNNILDVYGGAEYVVIRNDVNIAAAEAFSSCYKIKYLDLPSKMLYNYTWAYSDLTNLETVALSSVSSINSWFGNSLTTLKNVILKEGFRPSKTTFSGVTGITIYVESEVEGLWDDATFKGWNNGNKVVYGNDWNYVTFYDANGSILSREIYATGQIVRVPYYSIPSDNDFDYELIGWDVNGDGVPDTVPATAQTDLEIMPIVNKTTRLYSVTYLDNDGVTPLITQKLPYGSTVTLPEPPAKKGYSFVEWTGYTEGMTVTADITIGSVWLHDGTGHVYGNAVFVAPTCTEQGYNKYVCTVCDEVYCEDFVPPVGHDHKKTVYAPTCTEQGYDKWVCHCGDTYCNNYVEPVGHSFGEWTEEISPTCDEPGYGYRVCACGETDRNEIPANGHDYVGKVTKNATCTKNGEILYTCVVCGDTLTEQTPMTEHNYVKKTASKSFLEWLIEWLLNILIGYEGDEAYYYQCADCRAYKTSEEVRSHSASVQGSDCTHAPGDWVVAIPGDCQTEGIEQRVCALCGKAVEARSYFGDHVYDGENDTSCNICGGGDVLYGDANGDGKVNTRDIIQLSKYIAAIDPITGVSSVEINAGADANGDGKVNTRDIIQLSKYIAAIDPTTGESSVVLGPTA